MQQIIEPVVQSFDCELWGIDFRPFKSSALLRVYIDKENGVTMEDCSRVSYQLSGVLDVDNPISVPYTLEVSSPGIERPLLNEEHFRRYIDHEVKLRLSRPLDGQRNFTGVVRQVVKGVISLEFDGDEIDIPLEMLSRGKLLVDTLGQGKKK